MRQYKQCEVSIHHLFPGAICTVDLKYEYIKINNSIRYNLSDYVYYNKELCFPEYSSNNTYNKKYIEEGGIILNTLNNSYIDIITSVETINYVDRTNSYDSTLLTISTLYSKDNKTQLSKEYILNNSNKRK